jgi:hypothetical protein
LELRPPTQGPQSSKPNAVKLSNLHIAVSSFAAIAGVAIAAYQTFAPAPPGQQPLNVVVALDPQKADAAQGNVVVEKSDVIPAIATQSLELGREAGITAALKDGSEKRYSFTNLFDGRPDTYLTIQQPDNELNILVTFKGNAARLVTALEYTPPTGTDPLTLATTVDVIVLPEGQLEASGRPVMSFTLQKSLESQTFAIPGRAEGKGLWLRVSGAETAEKSVVGDFRILSEGLAQ